MKEAIIKDMDALLFAFFKSSPQEEEEIEHF